MYISLGKQVIFVSGLLCMTTALSIPKYNIRTLSKAAGPEEASPVSIEFRRDEQAIVGLNTFATDSSPEARCGSYVYHSDYIQRTLAAVTELESKGETAGTSNYPQPFGDVGHVMIFPLLRSGDVFDGADGKLAGPDRIAVGMNGKKYTLFTAEGQPNPNEATEFETCEYMMPENATLIAN